MLEEFFIFLALSGAVIASITDLRTRTISNKLTFPLILIGILGALAKGVLTGSFDLLFFSLKGLAVMFAVGYSTWWLGAWSAGDVKEFLFIAALLPIYPTCLYNTFNPVLSTSYPFIITVFINTLLSFLVVFPFIKTRQKENMPFAPLILSGLLLSLLIGDITLALVNL